MPEKTLKVMSIVGARPNFMKIAPIARAFDIHNQAGRSPRIVHTIVHTGQHYDERMSNLFFKELDVPEPRFNLEVGSGSHAAQTAQIMERFEPVLLSEKPDLLLLVGDVNSTIACALVAVKIRYRGKRPVIVHIEAGLRSFDRDMPEEINRILTDALSDLLFITEEDAFKNLEREGIPKEKVHFVGNVMIDTLMGYKEKARKLDTLKQILRTDTGQYGTPFSNDGSTPRYGLVTLHRPSNVDMREALQPLMHSLEEISSSIPLIFPVHPRTKNQLMKYDLIGPGGNTGKIIYTEPLGYLEFLNLLLNAKVMVTDSGGIQEEATFLNVPCITLRNNTERPVTVTMGTNHLVGTDPEAIVRTAVSVLNGGGKQGRIPPFWDGKASQRILHVLLGMTRLPGAMSL